MPELRELSYREVVRRLAQLGFRFYRQGKGSHELGTRCGWMCHSGPALPGKKRSAKGNCSAWFFFNRKGRKERKENRNSLRPWRSLRLKSFHPLSSYRKGTVRAIIREVGISVTEFMDL